MQNRRTEPDWLREARELGAEMPPEERRMVAGVLRRMRAAKRAELRRVDLGGGLTGFVRTEPKSPAERMREHLDTFRVWMTTARGGR